MSVVTLHASHFDGFSSELLTWSLYLRNDVGRVASRWFDYGAPYERCRRHATFPFPTAWIVLLFDQFAALESEYDAPITDCESEELIVQTGGCQHRCKVYAGTFVLQEHPEIGVFFRLWNPINQAVLLALDLPFRRPE